MSFLTILLGFIIGGLVSEGALIGLALLGKMVAWWLAIVLGGVGCLIGGFVAGLIAQGPGAGALAGFLTGLIVFGGTFLIFWLVIKNQVLDWWNSTGGDINAVADQLLVFLGIPENSDIGTAISQAVQDAFAQVGDINDLISKYFVIFSLIIGAIAGGMAAVANIFTGLIGGAITKKEETYDNYY
ncbi:MAG: hypothetical protein U9O98_06450 [Asgard group archaeon]|nr:hypothetical protein [Asgard group archaeon]